MLIKLHSMNYTLAFIPTINSPSPDLKFSNMTANVDRRSSIEMVPESSAFSALLGQTSIVQE